MEPTVLLLEARKRVAFGWCQHAEARDVRGAAVDVDDGDAVAWSLLGSLAAVMQTEPQPHLDDLAAALSGVAEVIREPSLVEWNDEPLRTQAEAVGMLERASRAVKISRNGA